MSTSFSYKITCDECPEIIEEDTLTYPSNFDQNPVLIARDLAESFMSNYLYDWEDETEPSDLFEIFVIDSGSHYTVEFWSNLTFQLDHIIIVELETINCESR